MAVRWTLAMAVVIMSDALRRKAVRLARVRSFTIVERPSPHQYFDPSILVERNLTRGSHDETPQSYASGEAQKRRRTVSKHQNIHDITTKLKYRVGFTIGQNLVLNVMKVAPSSNLDTGHGIDSSKGNQTTSTVRCTDGEPLRSWAHSSSTMFSKSVAFWSHAVGVLVS